MIKRDSQVPHVICALFKIKKNNFVKYQFSKIFSFESIYSTLSDVWAFLLLAKLKIKTKKEKEVLNREKGGEGEKGWEGRGR